MSKKAVALDDKYTQQSGDVYISSIQALVRLPIMQRQRDVAAGSQHGRFHLRVSGIADRHLRLRAVVGEASIWKQQPDQFVPGVNEELAAAAIKGTQWLDRYPAAKYDGVFALWYGKHLGVERACEALKVGNYDGSGKHGGVLVVGADDMGGKSSVTAAESEHVFIAGMLPVLALRPTPRSIWISAYTAGRCRGSPASGWDSRGSPTIIELTRTVDVDPNRVRIVTPTDVEMPPGRIE